MSIISRNILSSLGWAVVAVLLGKMICGDKIGAARLAGLVITAAGIVFFTRTGEAITTGQLILIATGTMWAVYALIVRRAAIPALNATAVVAVGSAAFYLLVYLAVLPKQLLIAPVADVLIQAGFQGILVSVVAIYAFNRSAELLGPVAGAGEIVSALLTTMRLALILVRIPVMRWLTNHIPRDLNIN